MTNEKETFIKKLLFKQQKAGITLIALVVTIIVLLILAGISILMLSGDNSILQKATDAKEKTETAQIREQVQLAYHDALIDGQGRITEPLLISALNKKFGENNYDLDSTNDAYWVVTINKNQSNEVSEKITKSINTITENSLENSSNAGKQEKNIHVFYKVGSEESTDAGTVTISGKDTYLEAITRIRNRITIPDGAMQMGIFQDSNCTEEWETLSNVNPQEIVDLTLFPEIICFYLEPPQPN